MLALLRALGQHDRLDEGQGCPLLPSIKTRASYALSEARDEDARILELGG